MTDAPILGSSDKLTLDADVFGAPFNGPLVHEVVLAELAARRRGTHSTRNRALVPPVTVPRSSLRAAS